jgi:hypothetical protein
MKVKTAEKCYQIYSRRHSLTCTISTREISDLHSFKIQDEHFLNVHQIFSCRNKAQQNKCGERIQLGNNGGGRGGHAVAHQVLGFAFQLDFSVRTYS